jgi:hypothetical protein
MKKSILLLSIFITMVCGASAQVCTPDTTNFAAGKYVYPDSLPCITIGQAYSGTVSIEVPDSLDAHDFVSALPAGLYYFHIDSMRIDSISAYPTGLSVQTNPNLGIWLYGGQFGCISITGTTTDTAGTYPLNVYGRGCGHGTFPIYGTVDSCISGNLGSFIKYNLKVCNPAGITNISGDLSLNIYPNPNQGTFTVTVSSANHINGTMSILDGLGRVVNAQSIDVTGTKQIPLEMSNLSSGVYLLEINAGGSRSVKQFVVK